MKKYYLLFDATPFMEGQDYIQVGLGDPIADINNVKPNHNTTFEDHSNQITSNSDRFRNIN